MPLAEELISADTATALVAAIEAAAPASPLTALRTACTALDPLPLRGRADLLRDALLTDVPGGFATLAAVVRAAGTGAAPFTGWMIWPVSTAVADRAVTDGTSAAFDDAMVLLADLTGRLTSEFALRTLLRHDPDRALEIVGTWTTSPDAAVRRLASEGTRPYLPWAIRVPQISARPDATISILDALYRDTDPAVRRSVANHLNDLSRDHADLVIAAARRWLAAEAPDGSTSAVVRHGLRTLVKRGHPVALELLGFPAATVTIEGPVLAEATVPFGGRLRFSATIGNDGDEPARLAIDYAVHHRKANGGQTPKVFKLTTRTLDPGERVTITKEHSLRPITTRRYHPGVHAVDIRVNGIASTRTDFELLPD
ncbi:MAG: DNA alkylation repair protein [Mycobacterium sp.]|nr:DNA alkylation repair protein [Mycobacterium sp.]